MALVNMMTLMEQAKARGEGVGSFSVYNLATLRGVIRAAEESKTPVIIQIAEKRFRSAPMEYVGPMLMNAARTSAVDVAVHLDHAETFAAVRQALDMGFTSVMYDGSSLPFEENVRNTNLVREMAAKYGADVEAELGCLAKAEDGTLTAGEKFTSPKEAAAFLAAAPVDALAIAIGNQHGNYDAEPDLQFDILRQIHEDAPAQHLVLHGGSGISDADFQRCIRGGITKINVGTAMLNAIMEEIDIQGQAAVKADYYKLFERFVDHITDVVRHHIDVFACRI